MAESPDYAEDLERAFLHFEQESGWTISREAREIIRHSLVSVMHDFYGPGHATEAQRRKAVDRVVAALPDYFRRLQESAPGTVPLLPDADVDGAVDFAAEDGAPDTAAGGRNPSFGAARQTIGGVLVMQNTGLLASMSGCLCWPR
jgi:hypothetical protein